MSIQLNNIESFLKKYANTIEKDLNKIVGVKTGALKNSLKVTYKRPDEYLLTMLDYGQYINPWKTNTGWTHRPGYLKVFDNVNKNIKDGLGDAFSKDVTIDLRLMFSKISNIKLKN